MMLSLLAVAVLGGTIVMLSLLAVAVLGAAFVFLWPLRGV